MLRTILLGVGVFAALFSVLIFSGQLPIGSDGQEAQGEVLMWGTIQYSLMDEVVQEFNAQVRGYKVIYREIPPSSFNQRLLEALANGAAPDLIIAPHQIILSNASRLYPFPVSSFSEKAYKDMYVDGASIFFTKEGALALPVTIDPLVLFYNRTLFSKSGISNPPTYWDEVGTVTPVLTLMTSQGIFLESAISLGAPNTPYMKDILMATVGQLNQVPVLKTTTDGITEFIVTANTPAVEGGDVYPLATAARFFSQFSDPTKPTYTWSQYGVQADDEFVAEKLAMYIGYASELETLRARNQKADFEMTYLPQTRGYNTRVTGAQMYGIATLRTSTNPITALTVQSQLAGEVYSPYIASFLKTVPALRSYASIEGLSEVISRSMLFARPWYDKYFNESFSLTGIMLADILSGRMEPTAAAEAFVLRLQELYTPI